MLFLPSTLERFEDLRTQLAQIRPIEPLKPGTALPRMYATAAGSLVCMAAVYRSDSVIIVLVSGTLLIALLIWSGVSIARSPHVDKRTKRILWPLGIVLSTVAAKMWFTVVGR